MKNKKIKTIKPLSNKYSFKAELWKYKGPAGWCFVTLPSELSKKNRKNHFSEEEGWGSFKVLASTGSTSWPTAIWYDSKKGAYLLPVKTLIRKQEKLILGKEVSVKVEISHLAFN